MKEERGGALDFHLRNVWELELNKFLRVVCYLTKHFEIFSCRSHELINPFFWIVGKLIIGENLNHTLPKQAGPEPI